MRGIGRWASRPEYWGSNWDPPRKKKHLAKKKKKKESIDDQDSDMRTYALRKSVPRRVRTAKIQNWGSGKPTDCTGDLRSKGQREGLADLHQ